MQCVNSVSRNYLYVLSCYLCNFFGLFSCHLPSPSPFTQMHTYTHTHIHAHQHLYMPIVSLLLPSCYIVDGSTSSVLDLLRLSLHCALSAAILVDLGTISGRILTHWHKVSHHRFVVWGQFSLLCWLFRCNNPTIIFFWEPTIILFEMFYMPRVFLDMFNFGWRILLHLAFWTCE